MFFRKKDKPVSEPRRIALYETLIIENRRLTDLDGKDLLELFFDDMNTRAIYMAIENEIIRRLNKN